MSATEPRALTAALQSPAFVTKGGALAMHVANRHVERWAPEDGASKSRPLRNLSFVDRLVSPWIESAQRSASLRMFSRYTTQGIPERAASNVSWLFPRPWYQDELDWMAAARQVGTQSAMEQAPAPNLLTTRGTYVAPAHPRSALALPSALFEYVAPSLSVARPELQATSETFSPLVSFAASQAAHVMSRAVAPLTTSETRLSPGLRAVLTTMLSRATRAPELAPTRASMTAPELVTPPAPRPDTLADEPAMQIAERYAEQHAQLADVQRMARVAAERELAARVVASTQPAQPDQTQARAVDQRQVDTQRRVSAVRQETLRLHEQSRDAAARDARSTAPTTPAPEPAQQPREHRLVAEIAAAVAALPPELAAIVSAGISARPERAVQAIAELGVALRSAELIARNTAAGGTIEPTRGPRVVMPAGLGGLVSTVERTTAADHAQEAPMVAPRTEMRLPVMPFVHTPRAMAATSAIGAAAARMPAALSHVAWSDRWLARFAGARPQSLELLAAAASPEARMQLLASMAPNAVFVAPFEDRSGEPEVGFTGTRSQDVLPTLRGGAAPAQPVVRFADDAETPDDMFAAIAFSASRSRTAAAATASPTPPRPALPSVDPDRYQSRDTLADVVAHVAPSAPGAGLSAQLASSPFAAALRHLMPLGVAPGFDVRALFGAGLSATYLAGLVSSATTERNAVEFEPTYVAPTDVPQQIDTEPLTTLRSALLSFDVETRGGPAETTHAPLARTMIESLARPMLGEGASGYSTFGGLGDAQHATTYAAPGMIAERAQAWSVAQERSSSDLAFDFVPPELVLAARVYGLGPAEAAQAARLAVAGPGQLTAMAGAVDRTFVQAMAIEAERRGERTQMVTAYPIAAGESGPPTAIARGEAPGAAMPMFAPARSTFGVERRMPRGAFLWPAATSAALGLTAAAPDGEQSMPLAALELLAAQAVAELGTYAALGDDRIAVGDSRTSASASTPGGGAEQRDDDVLASASALVPTVRREKFQALFVALSQSPTGRTWSPAARAARALALAGRGEDSVSARERATVAWDVLPMVYGVDADSESLSTGELAERTARRREELRALDPMFADGRPGLAGLSTRAGEALGSYVAGPSSSSSSSSSSSREAGAVLRAPTAAPELVQTGRPASRSGGGEVEIPAWFEQAARKMFESKSNLSDGISLAELTLVSAAPPAQVAASTRVSGAPSAASVAVGPSSAVSDKEQIDIEKVASDVYREVLVLMDLARARNGEPYL